MLAVVLRLAWPTAEARADAPVQDAPRWTVPVRVADDASLADKRAAALATSAEGRLHAVWVDDRLEPGEALYYARLEPGARQWSADLRVRHRGESAVMGHPDLAIDGLGQLHLVWEEAGPEGDVDVFHSLLPAGGGAWTPAHRVNTDPPGAAQSSPAIAVDPYGTLHVVWEDYRRGGADLYFAQRVSSGEWVPNQRFHHAQTGDQRWPALAMDREGWLHAAWIDSRDGRAEVYASLLPPGGRTWWPNAKISSLPTDAPRRAPRLAATPNGRVHALWTQDEGLGRVYLASLTFEDRFWSAEREVYRPRFGSLVEADLAAGPGGRLLVAWRESRADQDGSRIYAGLVPQTGAIEAQRVDGGRSVSRGRRPLAGLDALARAHVVWIAQQRDDPRSLVHSVQDLPAPIYPGQRLEGRLGFQARRFNCGLDGFSLQDCEGREIGFVVSRGLDLLPFLGSSVAIEGFRVADGPCQYLVASTVELARDPCPRSAAVVTGLVTAAGRAAEGSEIWVGGQAALSGISGRYFLDNLPTGPTTVTATLACGLVSELGKIELRRGLNRLPSASLSLGDVYRDCRIDLRDVTRVAGQIRQEPPYDPGCTDLDTDGRVGLSDLAIVTARFGGRCPAAWQAEALDLASGTSVSSVGRAGATALAEGRRSGADWERLRPGRDPEWVFDLEGPGAVIELVMRLDGTGSAIEDLDPSQPGIQALIMAAPGRWIELENHWMAVDDGKQFRWLAAGLGPVDAGAVGQRERIRVASGLGSLPFSARAHLELRAFDRHGMPLSIVLRRVEDHASHRPACCWLPWLGRELFGSLSR